MSLALLFSTELSTTVDGERPWYRFTGDRDARILDDGTMVLGIEDGDHTEEASEVVMQWAEANGFSLEGISPRLALTGLLWTTIMLAVQDAPDYEDICDAMRERKGPGPVPVPDFRLAIGSAFVAARLLEIFDRPRTDEENKAAFDRRTGGRYA
ncbi:hypothetical protein PU630_15610 [Microbacterium horticulturae]|uniref:Uncharacterized protein n=1 Tax=Microbacterium horticulturae TaxID=3028316 RepID=A0ABY8BWT5_9MICO|nr:hypothetical protein [Microbacterium sp. KACC 23027]WEG08651.1 hypothetical protein PU630_15610 [Microbacterium sp. KACC 23027]